MNCIPTGKQHTSTKNKNKTLSIASQKYEQRIKATKSKPGIQFFIPNGSHGNGNEHDYGENWSKKVTDIDNWRRDVITAMECNNSDYDNSYNMYDSISKQDSSTLTSSTLLSAGDKYRKTEGHHHHHPSHSNHIKITKSPSIPLFRTHVVEEDHLPKFNPVIGKSKFLGQRFVPPDVDYDFDDDFDDDVFSASICGNNPSDPDNNKMSSSHFIDYDPNSFETYSKEMNTPYTPQMIKRPWNLPVSKKEIYPEYLSEQ